MLIGWVTDSFFVKRKGREGGTRILLPTTGRTKNLEIYLENNLSSLCITFFFSFFLL
jgi:hypothetical protein